MSNELDLRNRCVAVYKPGIVTQVGIEAAIARSREVGAIVLEVLVPSYESALYRELLERQGFSYVEQKALNELFARLDRQAGSLSLMPENTDVAKVDCGEF